jgi:cell division protein FtsX
MDVRNELARDPDIAGYRFLDHADAYREFKRLFADQPLLIQHQTPARLPTSFRLTIRAGVAGNRVANRYERVPGVNTALVYMHPLANLPHFAVAQVCTKTP